MLGIYHSAVIVENAKWQIYSYYFLSVIKTKAVQLSPGKNPSFCNVNNLQLFNVFFKNNALSFAVV